MKALAMPGSNSQISNAVFIDRGPGALNPHHAIILVHRREAAPNRSQLAVNAKLSPNIPIPMNAKVVHRFRLWVRLKLSEKSCRATLAMIPAVIANMHP